MDRTWLGELRRKLGLGWDIATDRRLPWRARAPGMLALAYLASPLDLVPDWLPGLGWLDDVFVLSFATAVTPLLVPRRLVARHLVAARRQGAELALERATKGSLVLPWLMILAGALLACAAVIAGATDLDLSS